MSIGDPLAFSSSNMNKDIMTVIGSIDRKEKTGERLSESPDLISRLENERFVYELVEPASLDNNSSNTKDTSATSSHRYESQINKLLRDESGFITSLDYSFLDDGRIDWFAMIPKKYLVVNKQRFPESTDFSSLKVEELERKKVLILLDGLKYVARIRGYYGVEETLSPNSSEEYCNSVTSIDWFANYETNNNSVSSIGEADAHPRNTKGFGQRFLAPVAGNRSFCRCVRNFLGIETLALDEVDNSSGEEVDAPNFSPLGQFKTFLTKRNVKFENLKKLAAKHGVTGFETLEEFPVSEIQKFMGIINDAIAKKNKQE